MTTPPRSRIATVPLLMLVAFATWLLLAPAALASTTAVNDAAGDTDVPGLDIVGVELDNADYVLATKANFVSSRPGTLVVGLKARERSLVRLVVQHRSDGSTRSYLLDASDQRISCDGATALWRQARSSVAVTVPSTCLWSGDYGAVKAWFLTERRDGNDVDYAPQPQERMQFTRWVPRG